MVDKYRHPCENYASEQIDNVVPFEQQDRRNKHEAVGNKAKHNHFPAPHKPQNNNSQGDMKGWERNEVIAPNLAHAFIATRHELRVCYEGSLEIIRLQPMREMDNMVGACIEGAHAWPQVENQKSHVVSREHRSNET